MHTAQEIESAVKRYIGERIDLEHVYAETNIFDEGLVNSLFAIELMTFLEQAFQIKIGMDDLDMTNFHSMHNITVFVQEKEAGVRT